MKIKCKYIGNKETEHFFYDMIEKGKKERDKKERSAFATEDEYHNALATKVVELLESLAKPEGKSRRKHLIKTLREHVSTEMLRDAISEFVHFEKFADLIPAQQMVEAGDYAGAATELLKKPARGSATVTIGDDTIVIDQYAILQNKKTGDGDEKTK